MWERAQHNAWHTVTPQVPTISGSSNSSSNSTREQPPEGKTMEQIFNVCESLPMNSTLASQEKPQILILAAEHGAHSWFGSRDEFFLAKERSSPSVGRKTYPTRQLGGGADPAQTPEPPPALTANSQSHCHFTNIYRPLFPPKHSRPRSRKKAENLCT